MKHITLTIITFFLLGSSIVLGGEKHIFRSLTNDDGLSSSSITSISKDHAGFMWFGSHDGLNRWDGQNFKIFRNDFHNPYSIPSNYINCLMTDNEGMIWIGSQDSGLCVMDPRTEKFEKLQFDGNNATERSDVSITCLKTDKHQNIWAGSWNSNLIFVSKGTLKGKFLPIVLPEDKTVDVRIRDIVVDDSVIWIATQHSGLIKYKIGKGVVERFFEDTLNENAIYPNSIISIEKDGNDFLWLGTLDSFVYKFNIINGDIQHITMTDQRSDNNFKHIADLMMQGKDSLWIATTKGGLYLMDTKTNQSELFSSQDFSGGINYNTLMSVYLDNMGILWVGTNGKGLNYFHPGTSSFEVFSVNKSADWRLDFQSVRAIMENDGQLFVGGYFGLNQIDLANKQNDYMLNGVPVYSFCLDTLSNQILIGTEGNSLITYNLDDKSIANHNLSYRDHLDIVKSVELIYKIVHYKGPYFLIGSNKGMGILNTETFKFSKFFEYQSENPNSINNGDVKTMLKDQKGRIWVGTIGGGFALFDPGKGTFKRFVKGNQNNGLLSNKILSIESGENDVLWIGTDRGLNKYNISDESYDAYTTLDGLTNDYIYGIITDEGGDLWVSTNIGINKINPETGEISTFTTQNGLPGNEFNTAAYYRGEQGKIYFGGVDGLVSFYPSEMSVSLPESVTVLSKVYALGEEMILDTIISYKKILNIEPDVDFLTFEITGLNYLYPEKNYYQYRILQLSEEWINNGTSNSISFANIDPGKYKLEIRTSIDNINWHESETPLELIIQPQIYETFWFKILVILIILGILTVIFLYRVQFFKRQERKLKLLVNERTSELQMANKQLLDEVGIRKETEEKLLVANKTKDKFFSIIAHDLRSPFNALLGLTDLLKSYWYEYTEAKKIDMVVKLRESSKNTLNLLDNLLDWARIQNSSLKPSLKPIEFNAIISQSISEVEANAEMKKISIKNLCSSSVDVLADEFMLTTILRNLLSNSIKFTNPSGIISVSGKVEGDVVICTITDNGIGMNKETVNKLFNIKNTSSKMGTEGEKGTGLGLIITHEFIKLMNGSIWVESEPGKGSKFYIQLPMAQQTTKTDIEQLTE